MRHWFIKHMVNPCLEMGLSQWSFGYVISFVSAMMHEYVIAFALFRPTWFAFAGMYASAFITIFEGFILKVSFFVAENCLDIQTGPEQFDEYRFLAEFLHHWPADDGRPLLYYNSILVNFN
jgi:hypothetical protein